MLAIGMPGDPIVAVMMGDRSSDQAHMLFDEHHQHIRCLTVFSERQNDVFGEEVILERSDIGRFAAQRRGGRRYLDAGGEDAARWRHVSDFAHPCARPVVGEMVHDIGTDKAETEIPGLAADVKQDDLGEQRGNIQRVEGKL